MGNFKPGEKEVRTKFPEGSEVYESLRDYAKDRTLTLNKAVVCIMADWNDARRGRPNPFAPVYMGPGGTNGASASLVSDLIQPEPEMSEEEKLKDAKRKAASSQFLDFA